VAGDRRRGPAAYPVGPNLSRGEALIILDDGLACRDVAPGDLVGSIARNLSWNERLDRPAAGTTLEEMAVVQAVGG
jgi:hypothetical protein